MKIGLVSPYDWAYPGGVKNHIVHLAAELRVRGHTVRILTPATGKSARRVEYGIFKVGRAAPLPVNGSVARISLTPDLNGHISDLLMRERFDVLHLHEPLASVLPLTVLHSARRSGAIVVGTFHAAVPRSLTASPPEWAYASAKPFLRHYFRKLDGRIAVSPAALGFIERFFPGDYRIIPNGVDVARFRDAAPRPELRDGKPNVLFVGRAEKRKGLKHLLRAVPLVREYHPDTRFVIVSDGPLRAGFQRYVSKAGWRDVVFTGRVSDADLPSYYASADVFTSPAIGGESQGIVLLEALAAGVPTIASDILGHRSVITSGEDGVLVPPADHEQLAWAICHLLNDRREMERLRVAARERAEAFSWPRIAGEIEQYYHAILSQRRRRVASGPLAPTKPELAVPGSGTDGL
ncbi:MAG TPA: glycosyltransferase family 4 protein [Ktedonobacterales bacterium]|nr:glycosyltransferase family 4 protein [Ktedonobacterales bacterium]